MNKKRGRPKKYTSDRPEVFEYHDYREFLRDWFDYMASQSREKFSLRRLSIDSGLATCYLSHVLNESIPMTENALLKLLPKLDLNEREVLYLKLIRTIGESLDPDERAHALKRVQRVLEARGISPRELHSYKYLTKWYYVAIREMVGMDGFQLDAKWIQKRLSFYVPLRDIRTAIKFLVENEYIDVSDSKKPKLAKEPINLDAGFHKIALHQFYEQMSQLGIQSLYEVARSERNVMSHNIAIPKKDYPKVRALLEETFDKLNALTKDIKKSDSVYHIAFNSFPLAKEPNKKGGKKE